MKTTGKIICKLALIFAFLYITPFHNGVQAFLSGNNFLDAFVYHQKTLDETISIKDQLNLLSYNSNLTIKDKFEFETTQKQDPPKEEDEDKVEEPTTDPAPDNPQTPPAKAEDTGKRVYIYSTHQGEAYVGGETVMDASAILGNQLEGKGIHVVLETSDFGAYLKQQGWDYNSSYGASYKYMNEALANYGEFDMIIDFHRDSIPRESSFIEIDGVTYAKMMPVIGGLSGNAYDITKNSSTLSDIINGKKSGIMRSSMTREAYYNQQVSNRCMLIEVGGDVNSFEEVSNSVGVLADGIYDYLMR